jgi:hypothetical protein
LCEAVYSQQEQTRPVKYREWLQTDFLSEMDDYIYQFTEVSRTSEGIDILRVKLKNENEVNGG